MTKAINALAQALESPGCERIKDFYSVGPVQRAAVEQFVEALAQARAEQAEYFPTRPMVAQHSPSSEETAAAFNLGAGRPVVQATDAERRQFEAWMAGHNWLCAQWDGKQYTDVFTRTTWAAWRDRAELARSEQAEPVAWRISDPDEPEIGHWYSEEPSDLSFHKSEPLYTTPPTPQAPKLEPLTDAEIKRMWKEYAPIIGGIFDFTRAVEAAHKAKLLHSEQTHRR